ncbi:hypothetical protein ACIHCQ_43795 [Streptomyces sp. NPDC052236]|uniref:hypothetical protein n=1 Tax=Streptomyces sp. NPDC052236 TaxID=3365686 RepID=UPI0037D2A620
MATFLCKLGRLAFRWRWVMALPWVVIFCGAGFAALRPGAARRTALKQLSRRIDGETAQTVFKVAGLQ